MQAMYLEVPLFSLGGSRVGCRSFTHGRTFPFKVVKVNNAKYVLIATGITTKAAVVSERIKKPRLMGAVLSGLNVRYRLEGRVSVFHQKLEGFREPATSVRSIWHSAGAVCTVGRVAGERITHWVVLFVRVVRIDLEVRIGNTVRLTLWFHPNVGINTWRRRSGWTVADTTRLVTPVAAVLTTVDT
ncbi:hypothetical protein TERTU_2899 [Teredinibacter turnerae T7901]|uniref:Uncharacterized protein n=1 Tax=Teredinibacter turnerae (strain ATCC 39867 / T7901) TaxID=377629 RepID=C5BNB2_TERTT|nr:hypothetical protein TERTU_2899 [Teredinibacter turnerae T7901]